ncbi:flagella basal body P-ring formation protein FlgA [Leptospira fainei serovar Hurstbridge str. BUT 6]|uniref:Flagella basal body P-ring formation protein FlgA n=1 Tax=Leptospira fainei serovar Hurstbridge str. BUT 6 TaxID=1193011 RepID=S3VE61_9LEPT|nr:flagellar basal body P-ring formation chaperone FlgA [Leptospira fainei]EPG74785.1 flagella basal body P-ring formation protein FlgA [Leptospira fainei serovar Hurstbridge str. BUT 6]
MSFRFPGILLVALGILWISAGGVFAMEAVYLRGKLLTEKKEVLLSEIAKMPDRMQDKIVLRNLESPVLLRPEDIQKLFPNVSISGKETLILPLNSELDAKDLEDSVAKEIAKLTQEKGAEYRITYLDGERSVPASGIDLRWAGLPQVIHAGQIVASLDFYFQQRKVHTQRIKFKIEKKASVFFAKKAVLKGQKLDTDSLEERTVFLEEAFTDGIGMESVGSTALKDLQAGELLRRKHVRFLYDVQRGGDIQLVYTRGNLVVKAKTKALTSGNVGELVEVSSHAKEGKLTARVVEKNTVLLEN